MLLAFAVMRLPAVEEDSGLEDIVVGVEEKEVLGDAGTRPIYVGLRLTRSSRLDSTNKSTEDDTVNYAHAKH